MCCSDVTSGLRRLSAVISPDALRKPLLLFPQPPGRNDLAHHLAILVPVLVPVSNSADALRLAHHDLVRHLRASGPSDLIPPHLLLEVSSPVP